MLSFGIDWDDVISPYNKHAVDLVNEEHSLDVKLTDLKSWGRQKGNAAIVADYYDDIRVYERQTVSDDAKHFVRELQKKGNVYIITAVAPKFMGVRAAQIKEAFPDFPEENIIMGFKKSLVQFDITLDDGPHNILKSCARFPVLFRQPWNQSLSGVLSVNNYEEFLQLVEQIKSSMVEDKQIPKIPSVIALVGPSGSGKNELTEQLEERKFAEKVFSYCTKVKMKHFFIPESDFDKTDFVSKTIYAGKKYGIHKNDIESVLKKKKNVVIPTDICGAIALKKAYPTTIIFCRRSREDMIASILEKDMSNEEKKWRLLSMENELRNENLCDYSVRTENVNDAAEKIISLFETSKGL